MKKILSFCAAMFLAFAASVSVMAANDNVVFAFPTVGSYHLVGTAELGTSGQKYDGNTVAPDQTTSFSFPNSVIANSVMTNYMVIYPKEGGFMAGDTIIVVGYFNNSTATKTARVGFYNAAGESIDTVGPFINGRTVAENPPSYIEIFNSDYQNLQ